MARSVLSLLAIFAILCATAFAQPHQVGAVKNDDKKNPCTNLGKPPTVDSCWDCFVHLLSECDKNNKDADRRRACYEGANNFFKWCLGKAGSSDNVRQSGELPSSINRGAGFSYEIVFDVPVDTELVDVYVRDMDAGEPRMRQVTAVVLHTDDQGRSVSVFFDNLGLGLADDDLVGVVTSVRGADGVIVSAHADSYSIVTPQDLDGNGEVDEFDVTKAWEMYASGDLSYEDFCAFLDEFGAE